ncbi:MBL fold metallo-hydrolase [Acidobacteria bacterium AB60]|nr:MBL fold metallo-hydrolase [Acidobacteria bacterium AB60]
MGAEERFSSMECYICTECGTQYSETANPPDNCTICSDERQFVNHHGQQWTTHHRLKRWFRNTIHQQGPGVIGIGVEPKLGIGQRALLIRSKHGNVLWDCVSLLDDGLAELIKAAGGLRAIAVSHPHFHNSMVDWAHAFECQVYIHAANRPWVMRPDSSIRFWEGKQTELAPGMTSIHCGGHFPGSAVLHHDHDGGELFTGDTFYVNGDHRSITVMYSFPNYIPVSAARVRLVEKAVESFEFQRVYGQWWDAVIPNGGKDAIRRSAERYVSAIEGKYDNQPVR